MSTQSKSILAPFLIIAGLIFAVALGWKLIGSDKTNAEPVKETVAETIEPEVIKPKIKKAEPEISIVDYDEPSPQFDHSSITEEDRAERLKQASASMNYALRLKSIDQAISELKKLRDIGDDENANRLINFINMQYPNESIPKELLD